MSTIVYDVTNFPMCWVESIQAHIHLLPVTKIQFEQFLCDRPSSQFDQEWYDGILQLNERVSPKSVSATNYWKAFITGVHPEEARAFAEWCSEADDEEYVLPTRQEWFEAYDALKRKAPFAFSDLDDERLTTRCRQLLKKLDVVAPRQQGSGRTRADQMLMRQGVMEWVETEADKMPWGAYGQPNRKFYGNLYNLDAGQPWFPNDYDQRLFSHGFRLLRRVL
jgi:hypothetical protein